MKYLLLLIINFIFLTGCFKPRPMELVRAEQELLDVAADNEVVQKSPLILEQAAKTYHRAELTWRHTGSEKQTEPLALMSQELIADARLQADLSSALSNSSLDDDALVDDSRARMGHDALLLERRTGLAQFSSGNTTSGNATANIKDSFSSNRIDPELLKQGNYGNNREALEADLFFLPGRAGLSGNGQIALIPLVDYLKVNLNKKLLVEVHTNELDSENNGLFLAQEQADSIRNYFIAKGVSPQRIESQGLVSPSISVPDGNGQMVKQSRAIVFNYLPL